VEDGVTYKGPEPPVGEGHGVGALLSYRLKAKVLAVWATIRLILARGPRGATSAYLLVAASAAQQRRLVRATDNPAHGPATETLGRNALPTIHASALPASTELADATGHLVLVLEALCEEAENALPRWRLLSHCSEASPRTVTYTGCEVHASNPLDVILHHRRTPGQAQRLPFEPTQA